MGEAGRTGLSANRRGVLAGAAAGLALAAAPPAGAFGRRRARTGAGPDWADLARRLSGPVLLPTDPDFLLIAHPNNMRYVDRLPAAIARCRSAQDVRMALLWAQANRVAIRTRGGGHCYAPWSSTEGLMIETTLMNAARYDAATGRAWIGAGARNADVYRLLRANERAMTHGRCPTVGAAAFLLGGGIGFNMRQSGLACDQLTGSQIVLADGEVVDLRAGDTDPRRKDLFWAVRGMGGGNMGISTGFSLQTFSVAGLKVTVFDLKWTASPEAVTAALMKALDAAPVTLGSRISLSAVTAEQQRQGRDVQVSLLGQIKDSPEELDRILAPVYAVARPDPAHSRVQVLPYWAAQDALHEDGWPTWYQERSVFVDNPFGAKELAEGFAWLRRWPGTCGYCDLRFFQTGGQINLPGADATAFAHRRSRWLLVVGLYWSQADNENGPLMVANHAWQDGFYGAMRPLAGGGAYQNFADPSLTNSGQAYYGGNLDRLRAIRRQVDPAGVFAFEQGI
jgi:hypothetical protein